MTVQADLCQKPHCWVFSRCGSFIFAGEVHAWWSYDDDNSWPIGILLTSYSQHKATETGGSDVNLNCAIPNNVSYIAINYK